MPPKAHPVARASISHTPPKQPASPGAAGGVGKFNLVIAVKQIFVFKEAIKQAKEAGIFTDKEQKKIAEKNQKVAEMMKSLAKDLQLVTSNRKGKIPALQVEDGEPLDTVQDFFEQLIIETDNVAGNLDVVKAFLSCVALDYPTLCESRGLVVAAIQDGSLLYLAEFMQFAAPRLKLDPTELFPAGFFNQQYRIPLVSLLLKYEASFGAGLLAAAAAELSGPWNEFIADVASKKRAIAREDRNNRLPLLQLLFAHPVVKYLPEQEGGDGHTVFSRACSEGDLPLLELMVKQHFHPNINRLNGDGRTALMHAVIANSLDVVRFLLKIEGIDAHAVAKTSDEGSAIDFAKVLKRDVAIVTALGGALKRQPQPPAVATAAGDDSPGTMKRKQSIAKINDLKLDVDAGKGGAAGAMASARNFKMLGPLVPNAGDDPAAASVRLPLLNNLTALSAIRKEHSLTNSNSGGPKSARDGGLDGNFVGGTSMTFNQMSLRGLMSGAFDPIKAGPNQRIVNEARFDLTTGKFQATYKLAELEQKASPGGMKSPRLVTLVSDGGSKPAAAAGAPTCTKVLSTPLQLVRVVASPALNTSFEEDDPSVDAMTLVKQLVDRKSVVMHRASVGLVTEDEFKKQDVRVSTISQDYRRLARKIEKNFSKTNQFVPAQDEHYLILQEFISGLIGEGDGDSARAYLVHMVIERCDFDISVVSDMNALVATAAADGSIGFLKPLLEHPETKFDPAEALLNAMFNQTMRIPTVLLMLQFPERMEFARLKADKSFVAAWHEFFADVACRKRELPSENRNGRMELLELMLANKVLQADPNHIDNDMLDVFCRAAHDGDVEMLRLLQKMKAMPANVNGVYKDGTTILIHAVFSGDTKTVEFVLALPGIQVNTDTENGTALGIAKGLQRPKSVVSLLEAKGGHAGTTANKFAAAPELTMSIRNKTAKSLWDEAMEDGD